MFELIGRLVFSREQVREMERKLNAAGSRLESERFLGFGILLVFIISVFATVIIYTDAGQYARINNFISKYVIIPDLLVVALLFIFFVALVYTLLWILLSAMFTLLIDARKNALESVLPDFLTLAAANIKAGIPLDQAMWYAAKPEFGLLSVEVKKAVKGAFSGGSFESSLDELVKRFDSRVFIRTISLIKQASSTGGEIALVLEHTAEDARNMVIMKKEVAASLVLYEIFILFASIVGTPFLFAVAGKLIMVFEKQKPTFPTTSAGLPNLFGSGMPLEASEPIASSSEFFYFSLAMILITAIFASLIVSVIRTGTTNDGIKYFPFILTGAYIIYSLASFALSMIFITLM